jgi:hypothetical protein
MRFRESNHDKYFINMIDKLIELKLLHDNLAMKNNKNMHNCICNECCKLRLLVTENHFGNIAKQELFEALSFEEQKEIVIKMKHYLIKKSHVSLQQ